MLSLAPFTPCLVQEKRHKFVQARTDCFRSFVFFSFRFHSRDSLGSASLRRYASYLTIFISIPFGGFFSLSLSLRVCLLASFNTHTRVRAHAHPFLRASTSVTTTKKTSTIPHPFHHHHRAHRVINAIHTAKPFPKKPFQDW